jgi:hypothetical protein
MHEGRRMKLSIGDWLGKLSDVVACARPLCAWFCFLSSSRAPKPGSGASIRPPTRSIDLGRAGVWGVCAYGSSLLFVVNIAFAAPNGAVQDAQEAKPKTVRWYGQEPRVPLVRVDSDGGITPKAGDPEGECRRWAQPGSRWVGVDAWGQSLGPVQLRKRVLNANSHCFEVEFSEPRQGSAAAKDAAVLHASAGWTSAPSVKWEISPKVRAEHEKFLTTLTNLLVDKKASTPAAGDEPIPPIHQRTRYFSFRSEGSLHEFAVSGGKILVLAERLSDGRWIAKYIANTLTETSPPSVLTYEPIAVFDINHDGIPEVIFHNIEERWFWYGDVVLTYENRRWTEKLGMYGTE